MSTYSSLIHPFESNNKILTVKRGELCLRVEQRWAEIKGIAEKGDMKELQDFILNLKDCGNYSGVPFTNTFRVNRPISLISLGFFGPHRQQEAKYNVKIEIEELRSGVAVARTCSYGVQGYQGKIFNVGFKDPVQILPHVYYNIRFQLDGPETGICDPNTLKRDCKFFDGSNNSFEFFNGSLQMPELHFTNL